MPKSPPSLNTVIAFKDKFGFNVIPLRKDDKRPAVLWARCNQGQPFTDDELREFWDSRKHNPGIVTGKASMIVVVDADNPQAVAWVEANLPKTPWVVVTRRGKHYYYLYPATGDVDIRNTTDVLGAKTKWAWEAKTKLGLDVHARQTGEQTPDEFEAETARAEAARAEAETRLETGPIIDVRGNGGQVVAPGAVHPDGEHVYGPENEWPANRALVPVYDPGWFAGRKWEDPDRVRPTPIQAAIASARRADLDAVDHDTKIKRARAWLAKCDPAVAKSGGHNQLFFAACRLVLGFDLSEEDAFNLLKSDYNPRCQPPWNDKDIAHKVSDAGTKTDVERGYLLTATRSKIREFKVYEPDGKDFEIDDMLPEPAVDGMPPRPEWADENCAQPPEPEDDARVVNASETTDEDDQYWTARWAQPFGVDYARLKADHVWFSTRNEGKRWIIPAVSNNIYVVLKYSRFLNLNLRLNMLKLEAEDSSGQRMDDAGVLRIKRALDHMWNGQEIPKQRVSDVIDLVSRDQAYEPVQEWLQSLPAWDGVDRISRVPEEILSVPGANEAHATMFRHFMTGMVARIMVPGIKVDTMLFLVSREQGTMKSSFFRLLIDGHMRGSQWFSDSYFDLKSRDGKMFIGTNILIEWSEGEHAKSARAIDTVKSFLSSQEDEFRLPYGQRTVKRPRRCVFCGTSNDEELLHDASGSRRFYIMRAGHIDARKLVRWRPQLFAQALDIFRRHQAAEEDGAEWLATKWWFTAAEDTMRQTAVAEFRGRSVWYDDIAGWIARRGTNPFTLSQLIEDGLAMARDKKTKYTEREVTGVLLQLGCERLPGVQRRDGVLGRWWRAAAETATDDDLPI